MMIRGNFLPTLFRRLSAGNKYFKSSHKRGYEAPSVAAVQSRTFYGRRDDPFTQIQQLMKETEQNFNKLCQDFFRKDLLRDSKGGFQSIIPRSRAFGANLDLSTEHKYKIEFDFKGATPENISVNLKDRTLNIKATVNEKTETSQKCHDATYEFILPESVEVEALQSNLSDDGILTIDAPIIKPSKTTPIDINRE